MRITAYFSNENVPLTAPVDDPEISIWRLDTQAIVVNSVAMTEVDGTVAMGLYVYDFVGVSATLEYGFVCDGDPSATGQVTAQERYVSGSFSGIEEERIETDIPAILVDTDATIPGLIAALNDLGLTDVWADSVTPDGQDIADILTDTGTTLPGLIAALNNLAQSDILSDATPFQGADIADILTDTGTTLPGLISAIDTDVTRILDLLEATSEVDQSTDPWTEVWIRQSDLTTLITFELYDENLAAINNSNPISNKRVRRRLKV